MGVVLPNGAMLANTCVHHKQQKSELYTHGSLPTTYLNHDHHGGKNVRFLGKLPFEDLWCSPLGTVAMLK